MLFKQNKLKESRQKKIIPFSKGGGDCEVLGVQEKTLGAEHTTKKLNLNTSLARGNTYNLFRCVLPFCEHCFSYFFSEFFIFCRTTDMDCKNAAVNSSCPVRKVNVIPFFESTRVKYCTGAAFF